MNVLISVALVAFAGVFQECDAAITWSTPASGVGTASVAENNAAAAAVETIAATSDGTLGHFTLVTTGSPFSLAVGGALTVTAANTLDHETTPTYTLKIQGVDGTSTSTATLTVSVTDANDAPVFNPATYTKCMTDGTAAGTTVTTVTGTDQDSGDTLTYALGGGNTNSDFTISGSEIRTMNALDTAAQSSYSLKVEVGDGTVTATTTVSITVSADCNSATALFVSILTILTCLVFSLNSIFL